MLYVLGVFEEVPKASRPFHTAMPITKSVNTTEKNRLGCMTSQMMASIPTLTARLMPYMMRPNREFMFTLDVYRISPVCGFARLLG